MTNISTNMIMLCYFISYIITLSGKNLASTNPNNALSSKKQQKGKGTRGPTVSLKLNPKII